MKTPTPKEFANFLLNDLRGIFNARRISEKDYKKYLPPEECALLCIAMSAGVIDKKQRKMLATSWIDARIQEQR